MNWFTSLVVYLLIWWTVLFAVLPVGTKPVAEADEHTGWRGVPAQPRLGLKVLATSLIAAMIWLGAFALISSSWLSFRHGWLALPSN